MDLLTHFTPRSTNTGFLANVEAMGAHGPDVSHLLGFHHHIEGKPGDSTHVLYAHPKGARFDCEYCRTGDENYKPDSSKFVGHFAWNHDDPWHEPGEITAVETHPRLERRGIANAMFEHAQRYDPPPSHSDDRTDAGDAWAHATGHGVPPMSTARWADEFRHMWPDEEGPHDHPGLLKHFGALEPRTYASRPPRGHVSCGCCSGTGTHRDDSPCSRCDGSGHVLKTDRSPNCPGQPPPKRRHWRQAATCADHPGEPPGGTCAAGHLVHFDPGDGWHHLDGSIGGDCPAAVQTTAAAHWAPSSGIFGPTTGLDPRLFTAGNQMRPQARQAIFDRLQQALYPLPGWRDWTRVYLAGGSASEWAGGRPNDTAQDLDILVGVAFSRARKQVPAFRQLSDQDIASALNGIFRAGFNVGGWQAFNGTWNVTAYVNTGGWDIRNLHPYAAYDLSADAWAVEPPHLPAHSLADFDPAVLTLARSVLAEARAILRLSEPLRSQLARALWERLHTERSQAFSPEGGGWEDPRNVQEKYLAYAPGGVLGKIRELALGQKTASGSDGDEFFTCAKGHEHWGRHGTAGLLIRTRGQDGRWRYLLQKRTSDGGKLDNPGVWSIPSGATGKNEDSWDGAEREYREEMGPVPRGYRRHHSVVSTDCGDWQFHTCVGDVDEPFIPRGGGETEHEQAGHGWHTAAEVEELRGNGMLHPAFAKSWDTVRRSSGPQGDTTATACRLDLRAEGSTSVAGASGYHLSPGSGMIYLDIPEGLVQQVPGGVGDHHITVVYLGKGLGDDEFAAACQRAAAAAAVTPPLHGVLAGRDSFPPSKSSDWKTPVFVPVYLPGCGELRSRLEDLSASEHAHWRPHVTLGYYGKGEKRPGPHPPVPVSFTHLCVKRGEDVVRFPLEGSLLSSAP